MAPQNGLRSIVRRCLIQVRRIRMLKSAVCDVNGVVGKLSAGLLGLLVFVLIIVYLNKPNSSSWKFNVVLPPCPALPSHLVGYIEVRYESPTWSDLERLHSELDAGGQWRPVNCTAIHQVALVIPYRNRDAHLRTFLHHMHPFLQKQQLDYGIYVVEQASSNSFNRGMLMNIGFVEAMTERRWSCFIFHDVDLLPENDHNLYSCPDMPRHMSVGVDTMAYRLMYDGLFGGIEAFSTAHFTLVNGFSNKFFGWGGEDDDLYERIIDRGLNLTRYTRRIARYKMLSHDRGIPNNRRSSLLRTTKHRVKTDGLSSLNGSYLARIERRKLYTLVYADINQKYIVAH